MLQEADIVQDWINEGMEKGIEKGIENGEVKAIREDILDVLSERFGVIKIGMVKALAAIDEPMVLRLLHKKSVKVESLKDFARLLDEV